MNTQPATRIAGSTEPFKSMKDGPVVLGGGHEVFGGGMHAVLHDIDEISTDADISDEYGSASDSGSSVQGRMPRSKIVALANMPIGIYKQSPSSANQNQSNQNQSFADSATRMDEQTRLNRLEMCKEIWRTADAVCFDVDSTVCCDEAIDELARYVGKTREVSEITKAAMLGGANFREALAQRLNIIQPDMRMLSQYLKTHKPRLTPHIEELVRRLHELGRDVYLVSGGFDVIIYPTAEILSIPADNVFANSIKFYYDGSYAGFDKSQPTSNQDGKSRIISMLKQTKGYKKVVMVGDGVTDLETCPPADAFIGFGGNQVRETVRNNSDWFVYSFKELTGALP